MSIYINKKIKKIRSCLSLNGITMSSQLNVITYNPAKFLAYTQFCSSINSNLTFSNDLHMKKTEENIIVNIISLHNFQVTYKLKLLAT